MPKSAWNLYQALLAILAWISTVPIPVGKQRPSSPLGHTSFHRFRMLVNSDETWITRSPASLFGGPISLFSSARRWTCIVTCARSTTDHYRPRSYIDRNTAKPALAYHECHPT